MGLLARETTIEVGIYRNTGVSTIPWGSKSINNSYIGP